MINVHPMAIQGKWKEGYVLDYHIVSSTLHHYDEYGEPVFDTVRTELGEMVFRLKYRSDTTVVDVLAATIATFVHDEWKLVVDLIVPIPPSRDRRIQPVLIVAVALSKRLGVRCDSRCVKRTKDIPELKNVYDFSERQRLLQGVHSIRQSSTVGKRVLVFDDLFRSGATMNAVTDVLVHQGGAAEVYALAITRTRRG